MEKIETLRQMTPFYHMDQEALEPLATYFIPKSYERGDQIWREGSKACNFIFIHRGRIKIVKGCNDGRETILGVFGEDEAVGHLAVYRQIPYPAGAVALEDTETLQIHRSHFFGTIQEHPAVLEALLESMMRRNNELVSRLHELSVSSAEQRLAMLFVKFANSVGKRVRQEDDTMAIHIDLPLTRSDIADLINVRVETAIRHMSRWNKEGPVRTDDRGFTILDFDKLESKSLALD